MMDLCPSGFSRVHQPQNNEDEEEEASVQILEEDSAVNSFQLLR